MSDSNEPSGAIVPEAPEEASSEPEILPSRPGELTDFPCGRDAESGTFPAGEPSWPRFALGGEGGQTSRRHCSRRLVGTTFSRKILRALIGKAKAGDTRGGPNRAGVHVGRAGCL